MTRRMVMIGWGLVALVMLGRSAWLTAAANRRDREREEEILGLQAQRVARHVNAWKPQYEAYLARYLNSERSFMRVLLYDLSGWEIGRARYTQPPVPLNEAAARHAAPMLLRPLNGETPLTPYASKPKELLREARMSNRMFATNVVEAAWVSEMTTTSGDRWLVATATVHQFDDKAGRTFVSAWIQAAMPMVEVDRQSMERWGRLLLGTMGIGALLGGVVWASARQSRSMNAAAALAEEIPLDRLAVTRLPEPRDDPDSRRLVRACNRLLDQVAEAHVAQQRFVADAAHELRTPLTILRGEIQVALREPRNHAFLIETLRSGLDEAVHLSRLVDGLLTLARADAGQALVAHDPVVPASVVRSTLLKMESLAADREVRLEFVEEDGPDDATITGDAVALERVVRNLVENAVKHSPAREVVRVTVSISPDRVRISVSDRGIGIPPEHLPKLFDRFYRVDAARRRTEGGTGLGLAIVKTLVEAQGGTVTVRSEIGEGSTFTVDLPRSAALP